MRTKSVIFLMIAILLIGTGCEKYEGYAEGYIVGAYQCKGTDTHSSYCIILENDKDSLITYSLADYLFDYPKEYLEKPYSPWTGGPVFFPDSLRYSYKIGFNYRKREARCCDPRAIPAIGIPFDWRGWDWATLSNVRKLSK